MGYGLTGTLRDNPFEPDEMIYDLEHYLRMRDFMKIGKRGLQRFAGECSGSDAPQLPVGPAKIRLPRQRRLNLAVGFSKIFIAARIFLHSNHLPSAAPPWPRGNRH